MAQATPFQDIAATPGFHDAILHQRPPTPLGMFGKFPAEVRNQLYRDVFHGEKAIFALQWRWQQSSNRPKHSFGLLTASKTTKTEAQPFFYQYCQFSLNVKFSQDGSGIGLTKETKCLERKLPRMHDIVFEGIPIESNTFPDGNTIDQVAFIPIEPHAPDDCGLTFPDIFEDLSFHGREMVLHLIFSLEDIWGFFGRISIPALQTVFTPFRRYEIVKFCIEFRNPQKKHARSMVDSPDDFMTIPDMFRAELGDILGPGTKIDALEWAEEHVHASCIEYHPKSYFEAKAKAKRQESEAAINLEDDASPQTL